MDFLWCISNLSFVGFLVRFLFYIHVTCMFIENVTIKIVEFLKDTIFVFLWINISTYTWCCMCNPSRRLEVLYKEDLQKIADYILMCDNSEWYYLINSNTDQCEFKRLNYFKIVHNACNESVFVSVIITYNKLNAILSMHRLSVEFWTLQGLITLSSC